MNNFKILFSEDGSADNIRFEQNLGFLKDDPAFCAAAHAFEKKLEELAITYNWTQEQLSELCRLAVDASATAAHRSYYAGMGDGMALTKGLLSLDPPESSDFSMRS